MFDLKRPCVDCPFLIEGGIRLRAARVLDIAHAFLDTRGALFQCHRTVKNIENDDEEDDGGRPWRAGEQMCVGGMLFAYKQGKANQMMRIGERTGFDPRLLEGRNLVFRSLRAMLKTALGGHMSIKDRGFAKMDPTRQRAIASMGGTEAQRRGTAHRWTSAQARVAGKKGGTAKNRKVR